MTFGWGKLRCTSKMVAKKKVMLVVVLCFVQVLLLNTVVLFYRRVTSHNETETMGPYWSTDREVSVGWTQRLWIGRLSYSDAWVWSIKESNCRTVFATSVARRQRWWWHCSCHWLLTVAAYCDTLSPTSNQCAIPLSTRNATFVSYSQNCHFVLMQLLKHITSLV